MSIEMHFYITKTEDGLYHIQNTCMGYLGQSHTHTEESFKKWKRGIPKRCLHITEE